MTVEAIDDQGNVVPNASDDVTFALTGPGLIAAVGNGDGHDASPYVATQRKLFHGRAQVILRTSEQSGTMLLNAKADGLRPTSTTVTATRGTKLQELP